MNFFRCDFYHCLIYLLRQLTILFFRHLMKKLLCFATASSFYYSKPMSLLYDFLASQPCVFRCCLLTIHSLQKHLSMVRCFLSYYCFWIRISSSWILYRVLELLPLFCLSSFCSQLQMCLRFYGSQSYLLLNIENFQVQILNCCYLRFNFLKSPRC